MPSRRLFPLVMAALAAVTLLPALARAVDPGSQPIGCDQADTQVTITTSSHLDPSCTWTRGVEIVASDVVLDCQGAHIVTTDRRYGIHITAPTDTALSNIVVRNCWIEGFLNNVHIDREGFRDLAAGVEYDHAFSNIVVEDSTSLNSRGVGVFVDGYVTGVTLRDLHIEGAGSTGVYLEGGSKDNVVDSCEIVSNGYDENGPQWQFFEVGAGGLWFWGPGREGLAIDGSRSNRITNNFFTGNSAGGIFLYKNCGEFVNQRPNRWFDRRTPSDGNLIEGNTFVGEDDGVWVASRMGENTFPMDCSDPAYVETGLTRVVLDHARDNVVRGNVFRDVTYGVRVEDDGATIADNVFSGSDAGDQAIIVGTRFRTSVLGLPVDGATITGNRSTIAGNKNPYRWIHGQVNTTFADNQSFGRPVGFCEGVQPPTNQFIFVLAFVVAGPDDPPIDPPPVIPPPDPLPPCPLACANAMPVRDPYLALRRLDTPPGDDTLVFRGRAVMPHPFVPSLDPVIAGVGVVVADATGARLVDLLVPGGAYDRTTTVGWKASPARGTWKYVDGSAAPPAGITRITIKDLSKKLSGLVQFDVRGKRGSYRVDPAHLPLTGLVVVDPPTAETGQCGQATFPGPLPMCVADANLVRCR